MENEWKISVGFIWVFILSSVIVSILTFERECKLSIWLIFGIVLMNFVSFALILVFARHHRGIYFHKSHQSLPQLVSEPANGELCPDNVDYIRTLPRSIPVENGKIAAFVFVHFLIIGWCIAGLSFVFQNHEKKCASLIWNWSLAMASIWLFLSLASVTCTTIWAYITLRGAASQWSMLEHFYTCENLEWPSLDTSHPSS